MTKLSVLLIFAEAKSFLTPDQVCGKLQPSPDRRSLYSYLARLRGQGLLERGPNRRRGWLSYPAHRREEKSGLRICVRRGARAIRPEVLLGPFNAVQKAAEGFRHTHSCLPSRYFLQAFTESNALAGILSVARLPSLVTITERACM